LVKVKVSQKCMFKICWGCVGDAFRRVIINTQTSILRKLFSGFTTDFWSGDVIQSILCKALVWPFLVNDSQSSFVSVEKLSIYLERENQLALIW